MAEIAAVTVDLEPVARVTINNPPVNALNAQVRDGLRAACLRLAGTTGVKAVVLRCAGRTFVAGADIQELGKPPASPTLPDVLALIEGSGIPWVAAIQGTALGGGLELAMACHGRVAAAGARLGLPEVGLGILPGAGGTVRLPRLVPMRRAIDMITTGKPITAEVALDEGLVDRVADGDPDREAEDLARAMAEKAAPTGTLERALKPLDGVDWESERKRLVTRSRGASAPVEALDTLRLTAEGSVPEALADSRERFLRLSQSAESEALRHLFFAERAAGSQLRAVSAEPADLSRCGVIGGGTMGVGIATALLLSGSSVTVIERDAEAATVARERIVGTLEQSVKRGVIEQRKADHALDALRAGADYGLLADCGMVIEAVFEDMGVKRTVFAELDAVLDPSAIIGTNTSYLDVNRLAEASRDPSRVLGLHFFSPAHVMKLLEVVRAERTGDRALATGAALAKRLRKIAVVSGVCDGFIGNRIMAAYRRDCEFMLEEGAQPHEIDAAMRDFGFAMGIFEVQDMSGLDIAWASRKARAPHRDPSERYAHIADRLCEAGRLGRKAGRGWYDYPDGKAERSDEVARVIEEERRRCGHSQRPLTGDEIMARILGVMRREGAEILAEGIAASSGDIDVVMCNGYGFPRHRGGPMFRASKQSSAVA
jgi:3-hydroxyacyl-CoA dehydrogenase